MEKKEYIQELEQILLANYEYVQKHGYSGYDPQVYWYLYFTRRAKNNPSFLNKVFRKIEIKIIDLFPNLLFPYLKLLKIDGIELVPYGLGLFIQAYVNMYQYFSDKKYLEEAENIADILTEMLVKTPNGLGVSNSKKNKSLKFNKGFTDNDTTYLPGGSEVFEGFYKLYSITSNEKYLDISKAIGTSFVNDHKIKEVNETKLVLNYSSIADDTHILNANALAGGCLAKLESIENNQEYLKIIEGIYNYLHYYVEKYDYLPYAGEEDSRTNKNWVTCDAYHTGFTLRGIYSIARVLGRNEENILDKMKKMLNDFVDEDKTIKIVVQQKHKKQDVHAVSEYILIFAWCYEALSKVDREKYMTICLNNIRRFSDGETYFYTINKSNRKSIYMPRWSHAPMMHAISFLLYKIKNVSSS